MWMRRNNEVQFAGAMDEQGVRFTLQVPKGSQHALSRQVRCPLHMSDERSGACVHMCPGGGGGGDVGDRSTHSIHTGNSPCSYHS